MQPIGAIGAGFILTAAGVLVLFLKFTTSYSLFDPFWPPVLAIGVGILLLIIGRGRR